MGEEERERKMGEARETGVAEEYRIETKFLSSIEQIFGGLLILGAPLRSYLSAKNWAWTLV